MINMELRVYLTNGETVSIPNDKINAFYNWLDHEATPAFRYIKDSGLSSKEEFTLIRQAINYTERYI